MKKTILAFLLFSLGSELFAQPVQNGNVVYKTCSSFSISLPMSEIAKLHPAAPFDPATAKEAKDKKGNVPAVVNKNALPKGDDPAAQRYQGNHVANAPLVNFEGQGGQGWPPDPTGAAGPNNYVQAVNTSYMVYDKNGNPLMGNPANLSSLWPGSSDDGDPIVLYDKYADRWFISQFQGNDNSILIALSTTGDPLGTYYQYHFIPEVNDFPDYPKFSIWADGYYMTSNYGTQQVVVFNRAQMLAGNPNAGMIVEPLPVTPDNGDFFAPLPADADGQLPPYGTPCYMFCYQDDAWGGNPAIDAVRVFKMTTDWVNVNNTTLVLDTILPTQPFSTAFTSSWDDIPQQGTSQKLDAIAGVLTFRSQFRMWTGYNTAVMCHAVIVSTNPYVVGVRWYELRQDNATGQWSIYQQSTYTPDNNCRWVGSIAMDDNGSIALCYGVSSSTLYPGLRYTGRFATDPLGQMTMAEQTAFTGNSSQTWLNRYGDYAQTSLDPDGVTFWHTGEYFNSGFPDTRIYSFKINSPNGIAGNNSSANFTVSQNGNTLLVNGENLTADDAVHVDLFDIQGKNISSQLVQPSTHNFQATVSTDNLASGIYLVRIGNLKFQKVIKVAVN